MSDSFGRRLEAAALAHRQSLPDTYDGSETHIADTLLRIVRAANAQDSAPAPTGAANCEPNAGRNPDGAGVDLEYAMTVLRQLAADGCDIERALLSHIESMELDVQRYRWLRKYCESASGLRFDWYVAVDDGNWGDEAPSFDAAIDAARKEAK